MHHRFTVCKLSRILPVLATLFIWNMSDAQAKDWAQFQGPDRNGISTDTNIARQWPEGGPKELWSAPLGAGFGGPAISGNEVFVVDRIAELQDVLRVYSLDSGEELWDFSYDALGKVSYPGSRTTPTVTDTHVFFVGVMGDFYCIDRKTHKAVWSKNLVKEFELKRVPGWGIVQAPILYKDLVLVAPQSKKTSIAAFDQLTGKLVWNTPGIAKLAYTTPIIRTIHGVDQAIMAFAPGREELDTVVGISLSDGKVLWKYAGWKCKIPIPFPTVLPDNKIFITGGYEAGSVMIEIKKSARGFKAKELFVLPELGSQIHQPIFYDNYIYLNNNENSRKAGMTCMTLDGEVVWNTKADDTLPWFDLGNMIMVNNLILNMDGRTGILHLIDPSPAGYKELASVDILSSKKKKYWAPMAFSNGKLVLRSQETLRCIDLSKQ